MKFILLLLMLIPVYSIAQEEGVHFATDSNWTQLVATARKEKKGIMIDCNTTWCVWCKWLDRQVFPNSAVGEIVNNNYIAARIQFDSSSHDDRFVKSWYKDANAILHKYNVRSFPTMLFFDSLGNPLGKIIGVDSKSGTTGFIKNILASLEKDKQYFTLLKIYHQNKISPSLLEHLSNAAFYAGEYSFSDKVFKEYLFLTNDSAYTMHKAVFINTMARSMKDTAYALLLKNSKYFDGLTKNPISSDNIIQILYDDIANSYIFRGRGQIENYRYYLKEPDWNTLETKLNIACPLFAPQVLLYSKIQFFRYEENWKECFANMQLLMDQYPQYMSAESVLKLAKDVLKHSSDNKDGLLGKALTWAKMSANLNTSPETENVISSIQIKINQPKPLK